MAKYEVKIIGRKGNPEADAQRDKALKQGFELYEANKVAYKLRRQPSPAEEKAVK